MDMSIVLAHLRRQKDDVSQAIQAIERLTSQPKRRGRPRKNPLATATSAKDRSHLTMAAGAASGVENGDGMNLHQMVSKLPS